MDAKIYLISNTEGFQLLVVSKQVQAVNPSFGKNGKDM